MPQEPARAVAIGHIYYSRSDLLSEGRLSCDAQIVWAADRFAGDGVANSPPTLDEVASFRARAWDRGFRPVAVYGVADGGCFCGDPACVRSKGKHPHGDGWEVRAEQDPPFAVEARVNPKSPNTGLYCNGLRPADVDIDDPEIAAKIRAVAFKHFGATIIRWRPGSSRFLALYRAAEGVPHKVTLAGKLGKIEILGWHNQFVAHGMHESGVRLQWMPEAPTELSVEDLPAITEEQIEAFFAEAAPLIQAERTKGNGAGEHATSSAGQRGDLYEVMDALRVIPNTGPANWEHFNNIGMATWAAASGSAAGFDVFCHWASKHESFDLAVCEERWQHYRRSPPTEIGAGTLIYLAREAERTERNPPAVTGEGDYQAEINRDARETADAEPEPVKSKQQSSFTPPNTYTAVELAERVFKPLEWRAVGLLSPGLIILAGKSKIGKSWMAFGFGIDISGGDPTLGSIPTVPCEVLYLPLEDPGRRLQSRMDMLLGGRPHPPRLHFAEKWPNLAKGGLEALAAWLDAHPDCRVVIIDTFAKVRSRKVDTRANAYQSEYGEVGDLQEFAHQRNICLILVHHTRKADASDVFDTINGTTGLLGAADTLLVLQRRRDEIVGTLSVTGRDIVDDGDFAVAFDKTTGRWTIKGKASEVRAETQQDAVFNFLREEKLPHSPTSIAEELGISRKGVKQVLNRLKKKGVVMKAAKRGLWIIQGGKDDSNEETDDNT